MIKFEVRKFVLEVVQKWLKTLLINLFTKEKWQHLLFISIDENLLSIWDKQELISR